MLILLLNKSLLSSILAIFFLLGGMCKCILTHSDCYLESPQEEEVCLEEEQCSDTQCKTTNNHPKNEDDNCCPFQCLFKNNDDLSGEAIYFFLSKSPVNLISIDYIQGFISTPNFLVKPLWQKARSPSPNPNLHSQNSILRI